MKKYWILFLSTAVVTALFLTMPFISSAIVKDAEYVYPTVSDINEYAVCSGVVTEENGTIIVNANVSENDIPYVEKGQEVEITGNALGDSMYMGRVKIISSRATKIQSGTSSRTVVKCNVAIQGDTSKFKVGYNVTAKIIIKTHKQAVVVPFDSVMLEGKNRYVYLVENNIAKKQYIETEGETTSGFIVTAGVDNKSMVVYNPSKLEGEEIKVNARAFSEGY